MSQRVLAAVVAVPLFVALLVLTLLVPMPYVTYSPGPTVDVLAESDGREIIQVDGHRTYRDDGQLRMTTVSVTRRDTELGLWPLLTSWASGSDAVYPRSAVYQEGRTQDDDEAEGQVQMVYSQDTATAVALRELGIDFDPAIEVLQVQPKSPADGRLAVRDLLLEVDGRKLTDADQLVEAVQAAPEGGTVEFTLLRDGKRESVEVEPAVIDGERRIGIQLGQGYVFPFRVNVNIDPSIGGPSAGLMFSLSIYDTLTPGSLTGGATVAGTGEIAADGTVGPIGGIQQKIVAAREAGAELFLVPADNCRDVEGADNGDMRLVRATTMHAAREAVEAWVDDPDARLPSCGKAGS
ncbi:PDZ domain-containing protein [Nocardioides sp. SYSU D00038]|uniref:YlbL family protein n=1 Tax=Nocardioides sp. SYSU D00038 TaxID=2812554 RepID=UPI0019674473|nr:PDZ domain-containing protein [Nocardioides sp. SYSU D00038]